MTEPLHVPFDTVELYRDDAGEWRWRRKAVGNHEIIATSAEGYVEKSHCQEMAIRVNGTRVILEEVPS